MQQAGFEPATIAVTAFPQEPILRCALKPVELLLRYIRYMAPRPVLARHQGTILVRASGFPRYFGNQLSQHHRYFKHGFRTDASDRALITPHRSPGQSECLDHGPRLVCSTYRFFSLRRFTGRSGLRLPRTQAWIYMICGIGGPSPSKHVVHPSCTATVAHTSTRSLTDPFRCLRLISALTVAYTSSGF